MLFQNVVFHVVSIIVDELLSEVHAFFQHLIIVFNGDEKKKKTRGGIRHLRRPGHAVKVFECMVRTAALARTAAPPSSGSSGVPANARWESFWVPDNKS